MPNDSTAPIPSQVLNAFPALAVGVGQVHALGNHGGFSGARLWRVETAGGPLCLRAWPEGETEERLRFIHDLQRRAAQTLSFVPRGFDAQDGRSWLSTAGRLWELTSWLPGVADFRLRPGKQRLVAAVEALARMHEAWRGVAEGIPLLPIMAVQRRVRRLQEWTPRTLDDLALALKPNPGPVGCSESRRAVEQLRRWLAPAQHALERWQASKAPCQPCVADIWHDHVLFEQDHVSGIVDYGSVRTDTVTADLARLIGSLIGDDETMWHLALDAYERLRPLSPQVRALAGLLDWTGVVVGAGNWLRWLYLERRQYDDREGVMRRLQELVTRMEGWEKQPGPPIVFGRPGPLVE